MASFATLGNRPFISFTQALKYFDFYISQCNQQDAVLALNGICIFMRTLPKLQHVVNSMLDFDPTFTRIFQLTQPKLKILFSAISDVNLAQILEKNSMEKMHLIAPCLPKDFVLDWIDMKPNFELANDHYIPMIQQALEFKFIDQARLFKQTQTYDCLFMCACKNNALRLIEFFTFRFGVACSEYLSKNISKNARLVIDEILGKEYDLGKYFTDLESDPVEQL
jgi:hypothetical protein